MEKDMSAVRKYEDEMQRKIFAGQCFNNSSVLLAGSFANGDVKLVTAKAVFNFAEALFNEGMDKDWLNYGKVQDNRKIDKETGKVAEPPSSAIATSSLASAICGSVGGVPVTLTEKEGREMDVDFPESREDYEENDEVVI